MNNTNTRSVASNVDNNKAVTGFIVRNVCEVYHTEVHDDLGFRRKIKVVLRPVTLHGSRVLTAPYKEPAKLIIDDNGNLEVNPSDKIEQYVHKTGQKRDITQKKSKIVYSKAELDALDETLIQMERDIIKDEHDRANIQYVKDLIDKEPHDVHTKEVIDLFKQQYGYTDEQLYIPMESPFMPTGTIGPQSGEEEDHEMPEFEPIRYSDDIADHVFRSPQSSDSWGFSSASDSSENISIESVKEIFETIKTTCRDCINKSSRVEDRILRKIEAVLCFIFYDWRKASGSGEAIFAVVRLIRQLVDTTTFASADTWLLDMFKSTLSPQMGYETTFDMKWLFDSASSFCSSELYVRIKKFSCALMALAVSAGLGKGLEEGTFSKLWDMSKLAIKNTDIVSTVLGFIKWLLQSGYDIITGKTSVHEFFTKAGEMQLFDTRVAKLDYIKTELEAGRENEFTWCGFGVEIEALRKIASLLERTAPKQVRLTLANQMRKINMHWSYYKSKMDSQPLRKAPYSFMFIGGSSIAKSCLLPYTISMLQKALGIKQGAQFVYDYNTSDAYMSGFDNDKNAIQLDDAGNSLPEYSDKQVSAILIDLVNNNKRTAVMADLESKGVYLIRPDIVGVTTNRGDLHGSTTSVDGISVLRRINRHIYVRVKPQFATDGGMLRSDVDPRAHKMDVWDMDVFKWSYESSDSHKPVKIDYRHNLSYQEVQELLNAEAIEHHKRQHKLVTETAALNTEHICEHGVFQFMCNKCVLPQFGMEEIKYYSGCAAFYAKMTIVAHCVWARAVKHRFFIECSLTTFYVWAYCLLKLYAATFFVNILASAAVTFLAIISASIYEIYNTYRLPLADTMTEAMQQVSRRVTKRGAAKFVGIISAMTLAHVLYKAWRKSHINPQGGFASKVVGVSNAKNIYTEQYIKPMPINYDVRTASGTQMSEALSKRMMVGRFLTSKDVGERARISILVPIMSETVLCPWHILRDNKYKFIQVYYASSNATNASRLVSIEGQWKRIGTSDLCIIRSATFGDQKNILKWFPAGSMNDSSREKLALQSSGCISTWMKCQRQDRDNSLFDIHITRGMGKVNASSSMVNMDDYDLSYWGGKYLSSVPTWDGMCGSPIITDRTSGSYIVGLHSGGKQGSTIARFCTVMQKDIESTLSEFDDGIVPNSIMHESANYIKSLDFEGSVFRYTDRQGPHATSPYVSGQYEILGNNTAPRRTFRSRVKVTMWSDELAQIGFPRLHEAPQIINSFIPWNMWLTNVASPSVVEAPFIKMARDDYLMHVLGNIDEHPELNFDDKIKVLHEDVVLAGMDGVRGIDAVNRNTSLGIPYCKPKHTIIFPDDREVPGVSVPLSMPQFMRDEIAAMEEQLAQGNRVYVAHRCNLKDEAVKLNKMKVRVFMGSPFSYLFLMRKYFLTLSAFMQDCNLLFETAVGVNCFGKDWTHLYHYLTKHGKSRMVAGDYAAYDQKMEIALTKAAFEILLTLCDKAGYDQRQMTICRGLITETIAGCYDVKGEWIGLIGSNPSGHALTVVINSIVNSILVRAAFYKMKPECDALTFADVVALMTYGDDNIMGISDKIPWFNHTSLAATFAEWNITYTMADKDALSIPYITIDQCSFLKRTWVYRNSHNMYFAPLEESSIMKTLHTYVMSEAIDIKEQHAELLISANREYIMYDESTFDEKRAMLMGLAQQHDLLHFMPNMRLPNKEVLYDWLRSN